MAGGDHHGSASAKGQMYASSVDLARRLGLTASTSPADSKGKVTTSTGLGAGSTAAAAAVSTASAQGMDWKELLRKFAKHNPHREGQSARLRSTNHRRPRVSAGWGRQDHRTQRGPEVSLDSLESSSARSQRQGTLQQPIVAVYDSSDHPTTFRHQARIPDL